MAPEAQLFAIPSDVDLDSTLDTIMHQIGEMSYPEDFDIVKNECRKMLVRGILPNEIVAFQRCTENVNKDLDEAEALRRMDVIMDNIKKRMNRSYISW